MIERELEDDTKDKNQLPCSDQAEDKESDTVINMLVDFFCGNDDFRNNHFKLVRCTPFYEFSDIKTSIQTLISKQK